MAPLDDRRAASRREDDRWLRDMIAGLVIEHQRRLRKVLTSVAVGYLILVLGIGSALYVLEQRDNRRVHDAQARANQAAKAECGRVNLLGGQENRTSQVVFATLWASAIREHQLAHGPQAALHAASARTLTLLARRTRHTGLTACAAAVDDARDYRAPQPEPFNARADPLTRQLARQVQGGQ